MKFYGDANLQQNEMQNAVLPVETAFPVSPKQGQLAFVNSTVYICVSVASSLPVWVPLTREITAFTHNQSTESTTWTVNHGMNTTSVQVQIFDAGNRVIIPDEIEVLSPDTVQVTFAYQISGRAVVLTGHFDGNVKPTYAYTHYQSASDTTWVITHGLGYNPIVRIFVGNQEVQPATITHDSTSQLTVTFNTPQTGYARLI
jgi:hypothetical protein